MLRKAKRLFRWHLRVRKMPGTGPHRETSARKRCFRDQMMMQINPPEPSLIIRVRVSCSLCWASSGILYSLL